MSDETTQEVPVTTPKIMNGTLSIPTSAVFMLFAAGGGGAAVGGANMFGGGVTAEQVADIVDDRFETKDEVLDIKLQTINEKLERIEAKLDQIQTAGAP